MVDNDLRRRILADVAERTGFWSVHRLASKLDATEKDAEDCVRALSMDGLLKVRRGRLHITDDGQIVATKGKAMPDPAPVAEPPTPSEPAPDLAALFADAVGADPGHPRSYYADALGWKPASTYYPARDALKQERVRTVGIGSQALYYPPAIPETQETPVSMPKTESWRKRRELTDSDLVAAVTDTPGHQPGHYGTQLQVRGVLLSATVNRCKKASTIRMDSDGNLHPTDYQPGTGPSEPQSMEARRATLLNRIEQTPGQDKLQLAAGLSWSRSMLDKVLRALRKDGEVTHRDSSRPLRFWMADALPPTFELDQDDTDTDTDDTVVELPRPGVILTVSTPEEVSLRGLLLFPPGPELADPDCEFCRLIQVSPCKRHAGTDCASTCQHCGAELRVVFEGKHPTAIIGECLPGCDRTTHQEPADIAAKILEMAQGVPPRSVPTTCQTCGAELRVVLDEDGSPDHVVGECRTSCTQRAFGTVWLNSPPETPSEPPQAIPAPPQAEPVPGTPEPVPDPAHLQNEHDLAGRRNHLASAQLETALDRLARAQLEVEVARAEVETLTRCLNQSAVDVLGLSVRLAESKADDPG